MANFKRPHLNYYRIRVAPPCGRGLKLDEAY